MAEGDARRWTITSDYAVMCDGSLSLVIATVKGPEQREPIDVVPASELRGVVSALREVDRICRVSGGERSSSPVVVRITKAARAGLEGR